MQKKVVISLHGIRTRGVWQKTLSPLISTKGWTYYPLDYGYFLAIELATLPCFRTKKLDWFKKQLEEIKKETNEAIPSIIVHSFGSYLLAEILKKHPDIKFDKVILTGSIIERDFDWSSIFQKKQVNKVLNLVAKKDFWSKFAQKIILGTGDSGVNHFVTESNHLIKYEYDKYGHSDTHHYAVYKEKVIPFLQGGPPTEASSTLKNNLTHIEPMSVASWSIATYFLQFIDRLERAVQNDSFISKNSNEVIVNTPNTLVIIIPLTSNNASINSRDSLNITNAVNGTGILFGANQDRRSIILGEDGKMYDMPSFIGSFELLNDFSNNGEKEALEELKKFINNIIKGRGSENPLKIEMKSLREILKS